LGLVRDVQAKVIVTSRKLESAVSGISENRLVFAFGDDLI
jgi:hypothetical protein